MGTVLNTADMLRLGDRDVSAAYLGDVQVWPPQRNTYVEAVEASAPVNWWPLGDSDNVVRDRNGVSVGTYYDAYSQAPGLLPRQHGHSTRFDGGYADIPGFRRPPVPATIEFVLQPDVPLAGRVLGTAMTIPGQTPAVTGDIEVFPYSGVFGAVARWGAVYWRFSAGSPSMGQPGEARHVVIQLVDQITAGLYVNSVRTAIGGYGSNSPAAGAADAGLRIANASIQSPVGLMPVDTYPMRGRLQHVAIYDRGLAPEEIAAHYRAFQGLPPLKYQEVVLSHRPVAYWPLGDAP
jgi:hypothetical protein